MPSTPRQTSAERVLEAAIFAPIGLGAQLVDEVPAALTKARQQVAFARFIGKMAVDQGVRELRSKFETAGTAELSSASPGAGSDGQPLVAATVDDGRDADADVPAISADELALPDYDQLPAAHIIGKLGGLTTDELDVIEAYEQANRHRRTILGKIARLREG